MSDESEVGEVVSLGSGLGARCVSTTTRCAAKLVATMPTKAIACLVHEGVFEAPRGSWAMSDGRTKSGRVLRARSSKRAPAARRVKNARPAKTVDDTAPMAMLSLNTVESAANAMGVRA